MGTIDPEYERMKARRLSVLNVEPETTDAFTLEDAAKVPPTAPVEPDILREQAIAALRTVYDPEIPLNIYELGLIYTLDVTTEGAIHVTMSLTAPGCPVAGSLVREVHEKLLGLEGVSRVKTELVWEPAWTKDRLSEEAKLELGLL
jgi:FeS assembly SUF system protein